MSPDPNALDSPPEQEKAHLTMKWDETLAVPTPPMVIATDESASTQVSTSNADATVVKPKGEREGLECTTTDTNPVAAISISGDLSVGNDDDKQANSVDEVVAQNHAPATTEPAVVPATTNAQAETKIVNEEEEFIMKAEESKDGDEIAVAAAIAATTPAKKTTRRAQPENRSLREFGGHMLRSLVGKRPQDDKPNSRCWFGGGKKDDQKRDPVYVISSAGAAATTTTAIHSGKRATATATVVDSNPPCAVETLSDPRFTTTTEEASTPPIVKPISVLKNNKDGKSVPKPVSGGVRESTVRFALPEDLKPVSGDVRESIVRFALPEDPKVETMGMTATVAAGYDDGENDALFGMLDKENNYPSTLALPPAPRIKDHDEEFALKVQEHLNDQAMEKQLIRRKQRPKNLRQASVQFARSIRMSIREINVENIRQHSMYVFENARKSVREIRELDKKNPWRVRIRRAVLTIIIGGIAVACLVWFGVLGKDIPDPIKDAINNFISPQQYAENDPFFNVKDPSEADRWQNYGQGLTLEVVNALEAKWHPYFYSAVKDWDNGYPDTLTLTTSTADRDMNCTAIRGKVKVCNGDYGGTGWRGINHILLTNGYIQSSVALMNEFYTGDPAQDDDEMQYVMCHELGHAWGVLHTDETFGNKDLGNCMDYTNNEAANRQPDSSNFQFLYELYGLLPGAAPYSAPTMSPVTMPDAENGDFKRNLLLTQKANVEGEVVLTSDPNNDSISMRIRMGRKRTIREEDEQEWLQTTIESVLDTRTMERLEPSKWRVLHRNKYSEKHEILLSPRHKLQVYKLSA